MSRLRAIAILPAMFTLANLVCGFFAIVVAARIDKSITGEIPRAVAIGVLAPMKIFSELNPDDPTHNIMLSGWLILLAMVFDALDGKVARLSRTTSDFGGQLDSLCDVVTFGVAPAFLLVKMCPTYTFKHPAAVWVIAALFVICAALRLARYNVESGEDDDHMTFRGLPSPAAAGVVASFALLFYALRRETNTMAYAQQIDTVMQTSLAIFSVALALLMVSRIPYPHVTNQLFRGQRSFGHLVGLVFALVAVMVVPFYTVPLLACVFAVVGPVRFFWFAVVRRRPRKEPLF